MNKIGIIGSGFIGKQLGFYFCKNNFNVIFYDISQKIIDDLKISGYNSTCNIKDLNDYDCLFITVSTPTVNNEIDLTAIKSVAKNIGENLDLNNKIIVLKSTILPKTTEDIFLKELKLFTKNEYNKDFGIIYNPEFITEIAQTWSTETNFNINFGNEDRVVIGESDNNYWGNIYIDKYILNKNIPLLRCSYSEGEMIKYVSNCMLATKISYWNEISELSKKIGVDIDIIAKGVSLDKRIGKYGTITGKAFGGKCLPKDIKAFISFSQKYINPNLLKSVLTVNEDMAKNYGVRE